MGILKNAKHELFAQAIAKGESAASAYAAAGYKGRGSRQSASRLLTNADIGRRVAEIQAEISQSLVAQSIAIKEARIRAKNDRWLRLQQVMAERAADPVMQGVPGGTTGLLTHDVKSVGSGDQAQVVDLYEVDTGMLGEMRSLEIEAAKELGQWSEKVQHDGAGGGPIRFVCEGLDGDVPWLERKKSES